MKIFSPFLLFLRFSIYTFVPQPFIFYTMKNFKFLFTAIVGLGIVLQCYGQRCGLSLTGSLNNSNCTNTTYGGLIQDKWHTGPLSYAGTCEGFFIGANNTGFGTFSLGNPSKLFLGSDNTAVGYYSLYTVFTGNQNTAIGSYAAYKTLIGGYNSNVGAYSFYNNVLGSYNTSNGAYTLYTNINGIDNGAFGFCALYRNTSNYNTATGDSAGYNNTTAWYNTSDGFLAMKGNPAGYGSNLASYNTAVGALSLYRLSTGGNSNVAVGYQALFNNTVQAGNTAIGYQALQNVTIGGNGGGGNTATGYQALGGGACNGKFNAATGIQALFDDATGTCNTADGAYSSYFNISGKFNASVGDESLHRNNVGSNNVALGHSALEWNNVDDNTATGFEAAYNDQTGTFNVANGYEALFGSAKLYSGGYNTAMGTYSIFDITTGDSNAADGYEALYKNTRGYNNSGLGQRALFNNITGDSNTAVGTGADVVFSNLMDATAIGADAKVTFRDKMILGNNHVFSGFGMSGIPGGPTNRVEISYYSAAAPNPGGTPIASTFTPTAPSTATGTSGLQFRDLTDASVPYAYVPGQSFLTVDDAGNVVLMAAPSGGSIGLCPSLTTIPTGGGGVSLTNTSLSNFYFDGNGSGLPFNRQSVLIGYSCGNSPHAKLDVLQASGATSGSIGMYVENDDQPAAGKPAIGIKSFIPPLSCTNPAPAVAGWFESEYCPFSTNLSYSIFVPNGSTSLYPGLVSIGYPLGVLPSSTPLIGGTAPDLVYVNGNINAIGYDVPSDRRFKTDLQSLTNPMGKIDSINSYYFYYDTVKYARFNFPKTKQVGFIAQNVDSVLPEVVEATDSGYALDYPKMTVLLLAGIKAQQKEIDSLRDIKNTDSVYLLKQTVDSLRTAFNNIQECIEHLCNDTGKHHNPIMGNGDNNTQNVTLSNSAILYQNAPNPFGSGGTKISYFLPEGTVGASMVFFDEYGNKLKEVELTQTGMGNVNINPGQLSNGVYTYSLVINGNIVDTKKMVFQK